MTVQPTVGIIFAYVPPCYGNFVAYRSASLHDFTPARSYDVSHCYAMLVVGLSGLEPPTSRLSGVRSNQLSYKPILKSFDFSGDEEIRTLDPLLARQVLSQLSYAPLRVIMLLLVLALTFSVSFGFSPYGLKWTRTTDLTLIRRAL